MERDRIGDDEKESLFFISLMRNYDTVKAINQLDHERSPRMRRAS